MNIFDAYFNEYDSEPEERESGNRTSDEDTEVIFFELEDEDEDEETSALFDLFNDD